MEINNKGTVFEYNGIPYVIGETVVGTEVTPYEGLLGEIIAITQENGEENSEKPIFCCTFPPPDSPHDREMIEKRFSKLCGVPKSMEEIPLSMVLLSPEAVMPVAFLESSRKKYQVTMLYEDWAVNGKHGQSTVLFCGFHDAKLAFRLALAKECKSGYVSTFRSCEEYRDVSGEDFFKCWIDDAYGENHYSLSLKPVQLEELSDMEINRMIRSFHTVQKTFVR